MLPTVLRAIITTNHCRFLFFTPPIKVPAREASKKTSGSTKNKGNARYKFRGIRVQDGTYVQKGTLLVIQNSLQFLPGLNVGFGRNGTLCALVAGTVRVSSERPNLNMDHTWVMREYGGRNVDNLYKKYFHVIPDKEHYRFKLIDSI